ncbi:MAG TPA: ABC transporter permease [Steroidobacteraceae bacterium]|nr:ABC transporter permease [Steroidobacteraceae bacterium]
MLGYYFSLAVASLKRNVGLTALMIAAIAVGIGASMTVLIVYLAMAGDPIPGRSHELYAVQVDSWGPNQRTVSSSARSDGLEDQLSYADAVALMRAHAAKRQAAMYSTTMTLIPRNAQLTPYSVSARATYCDFFRMFDVPFVYGRPWAATEDEAHSKVVVISNRLNQSLFGGADSVGRHIRFADGVYRVVGVIADWRPVPRFYDLVAGGAYSDTEQVFLPFNTAIDDRLAQTGDTDCNQSPMGGPGQAASDCVWIQFWVELPAARDAHTYRAFLASYAVQQERSGRFHWLARTALRDVPQWLRYEGVVSHQVELMVLVAFGFFLVCLVNAAGLMLAKVMEQASRIATRRAIGASRGAILAQYLTEAALVGAAGGIVGLLVTELGLSGAGALFSNHIFSIVSLGGSNVTIEVSLAIAATLLAALYPTWRAISVNPASQLKTR